MEDVERQIREHAEEGYQNYIKYAYAIFYDKPLPAKLLPIRGSPEQLSYIKRTSAQWHYPVNMFKYKLLQKHYPTSIFFYTTSYDIDAVTQPPPLGNHVENIYMKELLSKGKQVLLTIVTEGTDDASGHAVAGILTPDKTLYVINTLNTPYTVLRDIEYATRIRLGEPVRAVDVMSGLLNERREQLDLQEEEDEIFCVVWMLNALYENGGSIVTKESLQRYILNVYAEKRKLGGNTFITNKLNEFKTMYGSGICSCSPDISDCPRCKKPHGLHKMPKSAKKWIQEVVGHMKRGAFTKQALKHGETPEQYAEDVLKHPKKHTLKTRRRAQFLVNIKKRSTRKIGSSTRKSRK